MYHELRHVHEYLRALSKPRIISELFEPFGPVHCMGCCCCLRCSL